MKVAISGAGIAGPTLAYWLHHYGHEPVLIERASAPRTGGYIVDFWGVGFDIAEKMGILEELKALGYLVQEIRWVDAAGKVTGSYDPAMLRRIARGRFVSVERFDLAATILQTVRDKVETVFDDSIVAIDEHAHGVRVSFERSTAREFDLVIGADGLHSSVRELAFGPIERYSKDLGLRVAAVELDGYRPREELVFCSHTEPGRQVSRFTKRNDKTLALFGFRDRFAPGLLPVDDPGRRKAVESAMGGVGWECPQMLQAMAGVDDIYYDTVSQIHMQRWSRGRVALIGDAASAVSLLAGEGSGLAMLQAYVLAGELHWAAGDYTVAFARYEARLKDFVQRKQKNALHVGATFVPKTRAGIRFRDLATRLFRGPTIAKLALGDLEDDIDLPDYDSGPRPQVPVPHRTANWRQKAVFTAVELLSLPVTALGYVAFLVNAVAKSRKTGISGTAYSPLFARVLLHESAARLDEPAKQILYGLPTSSVPAIRALLEPSLFAMGLSGYTPALFDFPQPGHESAADWMAARTEFFDHVAARKWGQIVILGAGYDTRPYAGFIRPDVPVFEVDRSATQRQKIAVLDRVGIDRDNVRYVAADFADSQWFDGLAAAGLELQVPTYFLWEGVSMYLQPHRVTATLELVARRAAPGSVIAFDFFTDRYQRSGALMALYAAAMKPLLRYIGEPIRFTLDSTPPLQDTVARLLAEPGLQIDELRSLGTPDAAAPAFAGVVAARVAR